MKNSSKSLQQLNEANFNMPNGLMSCNLNAENILEEAIATGQAPQCDIYDGLRLRAEFWHLWQQYQDYQTHYPVSVIPAFVTTDDAAILFSVRHLTLSVTIVNVFLQYRYSHGYLLLTNTPVIYMRKTVTHCCC